MKIQRVYKTVQTVVTISDKKARVEFGRKHVKEGGNAISGDAHGL